MPRARASDKNSGTVFYRARVGWRGGVVHLASRTQPIVKLNRGRLVSCEMDLIEDSDEGDTVGFIDWQEVTVLTWRASA